MNLHSLLRDKNDVLMPVFDLPHCVNTLRADNWSVQSPQGMHNTISVKVATNYLCDKNGLFAKDFPSVVFKNSQ